MASQLDYLQQQYGDSNAVSKQKQKGKKPLMEQVQIVDNSQAILQDAQDMEDEDDDFQPVFVENPHSFSLTMDEKKQLLNKSLKDTQNQSIPASVINNPLIPFLNKSSAKLTQQVDIKKEPQSTLIEKKQSGKSQSSSGSGSGSSSSSVSQSRSRSHSGKNQKQAQKSRGIGGDQNPQKKVPEKQIRHDTDQSDDDNKNSNKQGNEIKIRDAYSRALNIDQSTGTAMPAQTIHRDEDGKILTQEQLNKRKIDLQEEFLKRNQERIDIWGKGVQQQVDRQAQQKAENDIKNQPFAQYGISQQMEIDMLKKDRFDDPMNRIMGVKEQKKKKEIIDNPYLIRLKSQFGGIPNRFNIKPGFMWDGVDRSNGFERRMFELQNDQINQQNIAFQQNAKEM